MTLTNPDPEIAKLKSQIAALEKRVDVLASLNEIFVKHIAKTEQPRPRGVPAKPLDVGKRLRDLLEELTLGTYKGRKL